jgi:hypothetical protein
VIDWLLKSQLEIVRFSRWIVSGCALAIVAVSRLPRTPPDRVAAILVVAIAGTIFAVWLAVTVVTLIVPSLFSDLRRQRAEGRLTEPRTPGK